MRKQDIDRGRARESDKNSWRSRNWRRWMLPALLSGAFFPSASWGQTPDEEVAYLKQRVFRIPIEVAAENNENIKELRLFASSDRGTTWTKVAVVPPTQKQFTFRAKVDGEYWFSLAYVDQSGNVEPSDVRLQQPGLRVTVDTTAPVIQLRPLAGPLGVAWSISDESEVDLASLRMECRDKREGQWEALSPDGAIQGEIGLPGSGSAYVVRATVEDKAGNTGTAEIEVTGAEGAPPVNTVSATSPSPQPSSDPGADYRLPPPPRLDQQMNVASPPASADLSMMAQAPPQPIQAPPSVAPSPPSSVRDMPGSVISTHTAAKPTQPVIPPANEVVPFDRMRPDLPADASVSPAPTMTSHTPMGRPISPVPLAERETIASSSVPTPTHTVRKPAVETPPPAPQIPLLNSPHFAVDYAVRGVGPAGVGKVEMYVTRDNGVKWELLGEDADKTPPFEVTLPSEGRFGLAVVVTSPAGNGQKPPQSGDVPKVQVEVDVTAPEAKLFRPVPDPENEGQALLISWNAIDPHLTDRPVRLYFAEKPEGPWYAVTREDLPASGQYSWLVPPRTPHEVYLRLIATDMCNNLSAATTPEPVLVDLSKPEGEVIGIAILPGEPVR